MTSCSECRILIGANLNFTSQIKIRHETKEVEWDGEFTTLVTGSRSVSMPALGKLLEKQMIEKQLLLE